MKKQVLIICISLAIFSCQEDDNLLDDQIVETFVGDVTLLTQQEVIDFGMLGYDVIDGFLEIGYNNFTGIDIDSEIIDLLPLSQLDSISGHLAVSNNPNLNSLRGLHNIVNVGDYLNLNNNNISGIELSPNLPIGGGIFISNNDNLQSSNFFQYVTTINGTLRIAEGQFNSLGFTNLNSISGSLIISSTSMTSLSEFSNLNSISGGLSITRNNNLTNLVGLEGITSIDSTFQIVENDSLETLEGLNNLVSLSAYSAITTNLSLTSLEGLENLSSVIDFYVGINPSGSNIPSQALLTDFCALSNLVINGNYNSIIIENNSYNPTVQDIIDGNCSQ